MLNPEEVKQQLTMTGEAMLSLASNLQYGFTGLSLDSKTLIRLAYTGLVKDTLSEVAMAYAAGNQKVLRLGLDRIDEIFSLTAE